MNYLIPLLLGYPPEHITKDPLHFFERSNLKGGEVGNELSILVSDTSATSILPLIKSDSKVNNYDPIKMFYPEEFKFRIS